LCWKYLLRKLRTFVRREQHAGKIDNTKRANESFENVIDCKCLGTAVSKKICIRQEINKANRKSDKKKKMELDWTHITQRSRSNRENSIRLESSGIQKKR
jgi:hypothetical protein